MNLLIVLLLSIVSILFLLIGTFIVFSTKNSKKVMVFSVSLGFVVLILLGFVHLLPDAYEFFYEDFSKSLSYLFLLIFTILGFVIVLVLDHFGGHHHEYESNEEKDHFHHISVVTCIFLVLHNFIEGTTIYSSVLLNYETAIMLTIGIGLHNIPLGFTLSSAFNKVYSKGKTLLYIILIGISYLFGGGVAYIFNDILMNSFAIGALLTFTFGMVLYIAVYEFLPIIKESKENKIRNIGFLVGIFLMAISVFL